MRLSIQTIKRFGKFYKKAKQRFNFEKIYDKAKEIEKTKKGITNYELETLLSPDSKLFSIICDDQVEQIDIKTEKYYIVNLDTSQGPGTHWIALGIFQETIEFFDPLGCELLNWPNLPIGLLKFLFEASFEKTIVRIERLQSNVSVQCGLYCLFYVMHRQNFSLQAIIDYFGHQKDNDQKLIRYFR